MAYLATRGGGHQTLKTTSVKQVTQTSSYLTSQCNFRTNSFLDYSTSVYTQSTGVGYARTSVNGELVSFYPNLPYRSESLYPDGTVDCVINLSSGYRIVKSYTDMGTVSTTTDKAKYSGSPFCNPTLGTKRLAIRTGKGKNDVVKYGLTTNTNAKEYCGIRMNIDGNTACIGRVEEVESVFTQSKNRASTRSSVTYTVTSTVSSSTSSRWYTGTGTFNSYSYYYTSFTADINGVVTYESSAKVSTSSEKVYGGYGPSGTATGSRSSSYTYWNSYTTSYTASGISGNITTYSTSKQTQNEVTCRVTSSYHLKYGSNAEGKPYNQTSYLTRVSTYAYNKFYYGTSKTTCSIFSTSRSTYYANYSGTYVTDSPHLTSTVGSTGSYTTTSFCGHQTNYTRYPKLSSSYSGSFYSAPAFMRLDGGYIASISASSLNKTLTNSYTMTNSVTSSESTRSSTNSYTSRLNQSSAYPFISAGTGNKTTSFEDGVMSISADSSIFSVVNTGYRVSSHATDFRRISVFGHNQVFSVTTQKTTTKTSSYAASNSTLTSNTGTGNLPQGLVYTTTSYVTASRTRSSLIHNGATSYTSTNDNIYAISFTRNYTHRITHNGYTITEWFQASRTIFRSYEASCPSCGVYTSTTVQSGFCPRCSIRHNVLIDLMIVDMLGEYVTTGYVNHTASCTYFWTNYASISKRISSGTRTTNYSTSIHTTYSNTNLTSSGNGSVSWWQRTSSSYTTSTTSARVSGSYRYSATSTYRTNTTTYPATISKTTNEFVHSYSGTSNVTLTSTGTMTSTLSSINGYTMTASIRTITNTTSRTTAYSSYYTQSICHTTSYKGTMSSTNSSDTTVSGVRVDMNGYTFSFTKYSGQYTRAMENYSATTRHVDTDGIRVRVSSTTDGSRFTTSTHCYTTYTHILDGTNKTGKYIFPSGVTDGITITSHNYSTYTVRSINSSRSTSWTSSNTYSSMYAGNITESTCQAYSCTNSHVSYYTTSTRYWGSAKIAEYSNGSYITSRITPEYVYTSTSSSLRKTTTWKKDFFSKSTHNSIRGYTTTYIDTLSSRTSLSTSTGTRYSVANWAEHGYTFTSWTNSGQNYASNNFTIVTSSTINSRTSRTTYASYYLSISTIYRTIIPSSYLSERYTTRTTGYYSTWSGYEVSSSRTLNIVSNGPYILTSVSEASHGNEFGIIETTGVSYMSLPSAVTNGSIFTYSYHTNASSSYYSSHSTYGIAGSVTHGFIYNRSSSKELTNSSATTYELHYTGSEVYVLPKNTGNNVSRSFTSTTELTSFTQFVGSIAASLGVLMSYTKATLSKSYLKYMTSSTTMKNRFTSHNYNI